MRDTDMQTDAGAVAADLPSQSRRQPALRAPEFPGCRPIPLKHAELSAYDGRFEYWDGDTETAWVVCEPTLRHPRTAVPAPGGPEPCDCRGARLSIECYGTMDLLLRNEQGEKWRIMQADQSVYLHPWRARLPTEAMEIGWHDRPDVVLEVDHTTDVRRGKLGLYEAWGFPEVWVDVPEAGYAVRRPAGLSPGLTIHLLEDGGYRTAPQSRAFPRVDGGGDSHGVERSGVVGGDQPGAAPCGAGLGAREGTGPDDTPWLRMERRESRAEGRAEGERALLIRQAARRFGVKTAQRLSTLLLRIEDPGRLAEVSDWLVDCATSAELLDRVTALDSIT